MRLKRKVKCIFKNICLVRELELFLYLIQKINMKGVIKISLLSLSIKSKLLYAYTWTRDGKVLETTTGFRSGNCTEESIYSWVVKTCLDIDFIPMELSFFFLLSIVFATSRVQATSNSRRCICERSESV
jgi:hypothetical protein